MLQQVVLKSIMITSFVFVMMLLIEYVNVLTQGDWHCKLQNRRWGQYLFAALMGAIPGCLGAFTVVSLYTHRILTLGALVAAMIATSGDEAYVMLALVPDKFVLITLAIFLIGVLSGWTTDLIFRRHRTGKSTACEGFQIHEKEACKCFPGESLLIQWRHCTLGRGSLSIFMALFIIFLILGIVGPPTWNWIRFTLLFIAGLGLFVVATVPDHFLESHLWKHVAVRHVPRLFAWTFGAMAVIGFLERFVDVQAWIHQSHLIVLLVACIVGIIPESGPHLVFLTLYAEGTLPLSILLASSIVQDGHGMLPMLAHSRRGFVIVKGINVVWGLAVGLLGYFTGW